MASTLYRSGAATTVLSAEREFDADRSLINDVANIVDPDGTPVTVSRYDYADANATPPWGYDNLGRRTAVVHTGTAFGSSHHLDFGYNDRSELTGTDRKTGTVPGQGTAMTPGVFDFTYDNIGNRENSTDDSGTTYYCVDETDDESVNTYKYVGSGPVTCASVTPNFAYDVDGNLTQDDSYEYTWDGENRLIGIEPVSPNSGDKKIAFVYDYMGRRVRKTVSSYNGSTWAVASDVSFVYDGWNVILVLTPSSPSGSTLTPLTKYVWGLDLSGSTQGAGGIGGLLAAAENWDPTDYNDNKVYWFCYDGSGNVSQILDATDHSPMSDMRIVAHYEYDPYGTPIVVDNDRRYLNGTPQTSNDGYALDNPMRFSTKWFDTELAGPSVGGAVGTSGLGYWGYRYYSPGLGRWMSRDPIGEAGAMRLKRALNRPDSFVVRHGLSKRHESSVHLYRYVQNKPHAAYDPLGLFISSESDQIGTLDEAIRAASKASEDTSFAGLMRWGRFTAAMGGFGAWEAVVSAAGLDSGSTARMPLPRYIYTCRCGLIDLRHFYQLMYIGLLEGNASAVEWGIDHEEKHSSESKYAPEDITSNALGAYFGSRCALFHTRSGFIADLKKFLSHCDPVDWHALDPEKQRCIVNHYATDKDGDQHRRKTAGSDGDCCGVCAGKDTTFPFDVDPEAPARIIGFSGE